MLRYFLLLFILLIFGCRNADKNTSDAKFNLLSSDKTKIDFINHVEDKEEFNVLSYRNFYNGGGVGIGDINNDGLVDVLFTANIGDNKLYLNKGDMTFEDISTKAGITGKKNSWTTGVSMADVNADGFLDIYICYSGDKKNQNKVNELYINNGNLTFSERAKEYGLDDSGSSTQANFFDFDLDGDLDCFILNNSYENPERLNNYSRSRLEYGASGGDRLYKNENGKFKDITQAAGIFSSNIGFGLGVSIGDVNNDLFPDIYISNDFWERDYLYINQKNGTYKEELTNRMPYVSLSSMGSDIADINNDGNFDIFTTDMLPPDNYRSKAATSFDDFYQHNRELKDNHYYQFIQNCLQINNGDAEFTETAFFSGVSATDWSWGALIFDMNLDGNKDIFVSNGLFHDITDQDFVDFISDQDEIKKMVEKSGKYDFRDFLKLLPDNPRQNYAFLNQGGLKFENAAENIGMNQSGFSNGSAYGDLDNDGDFDLVVNNVNTEAFVYKNMAVENGNNFLKLKLKGPAKNNNGIGTKAMLYSDGKMQVLQSMAARGFQSSVDVDLIFGLGNSTKIDSIRIIWPNNNSELMVNPKVNSILEVSYNNSRKDYNPTIEHVNKIFDLQTVNDFEGNSHIENNYIDFDKQNLMPHMLSNEGPEIVSGDVNSDGKIDFIIGGSSGNPDQLFLNTGKTFTKFIQKDFIINQQSETVCGALFDADNDGDLDYIAGMGGNQVTNGIEGYKTQYYTNDGKGNFKLNTTSGPNVAGFVGCIKPGDFDKDGDIDLFIGGRAVPGAYGISPRSFMLRNDSGKWVDVTNKFTGPIGMVTDAVWTDVNNDSFQDLIVVGEWMPVTVFINEKGVFDEPKIIPGSNGWWNTIEKADIDQDGDIDYLLGNWGLNMKFKASDKKPLNAYVNDFDKNKRPDIILEWFGMEDEKPFPFASKKDLTAEMPFLKKSLLKYHDYAQKQVKDIFDSDDLSNANFKSVTNFSSSILLNDKGNLVLNPLPMQAQLSPIFAFVVADLDNDGITDYTFGGNYYNLKPEVGRNDGFKGGYFKGIGKGTFKYIPAHKCGLKIYGEVRSMKIIDKKILIGRNNNTVLAFNEK